MSEILFLLLVLTLNLTQGETCGGSLTEFPGTFRTPVAFKRRIYPHNQDCEWTITADENTIIYLVFDYFLLEDSTDCIFDALEVFSGDELIGIYCGTTTLQGVQAWSQMTVKFRSDSGGSDRGFVAHYFQRPASNVCWDANLVIQYGGNMSQTANGHTCQAWSSQSPHTHRFQEEAAYPMDGSVEAAENYCRSPDNVKKTWCYTQHPDIRWEYCNYPPCTMFDEFCGKTLRQPSGFIFSPDWDNDGLYDLLVDCSWTITAEADERIELEILSIDIEVDETCDYDYIKVFFEDILLDTFCGETIPAPIKSASRMNIYFHSDSSESGAGFNATYDHIEVLAEAGCREELTTFPGTLGFVTDDIFASTDIDCQWTILSEGEPVELKILYMYIFETFDCDPYFLAVYEGSKSEGRLVRKLCGNHLPLPEVFSSGRSFLHLHVYGGSLNEGFEGAYTIFSHADERLECGEMLHNDTGWFKSPDVDGDGYYDYNVDCRWTIVVQSGKIVQFFIMEFDLERESTCRYDHLSVYDGQDDSAALLGTYCGIQAPIKFRSTSNTLYAIFTSDGSVSGTGFEAGFSVADEFAWKQWPDGDYAIPETVYGCPDQDINHWTKGYINITLMVDASLLESKIGHVSRKDDLFMLGPYGARQFQLDFCVKHRINGEPLHNNPATTDWHKKIRETTEWPRGSYSIHQMTKNCPEGFESKHEEGWTTNGMVSAYGDVPLMENLDAEGFFDGGFVSFIMCLKRNITDTVTYQKDLRFPFAVIAQSISGDITDIEKRTLMNGPVTSMQLVVEDFTFKYADYVLDPIVPWFTYGILLPNDMEELFLESQANLSNVHPVLTLGQPLEIFEGDIFQDKAVCFLYDLGQSVLISGVRFVAVSNIHENGNISRHKKPPTILLSHRKWTFLNHGSWHCLPYTVVDIGKIEVYCLNEVSARYVALKADAKSMDILEGIRLRSWSVQLLTDRSKDLQTCGQVLGMRDGFIEDFQIWSSSEEPDFPSQKGRPGDVGWCPNIEDVVTYFFQVDLIRPTVIEGVHIFQVKAALTVYSAFEKLGLSFEFQNESALLSRDGKGSNAISIEVPLLDEQVILFASAVTARYLRIYSMYLSADSEINRCHMFEIIGCQRSDGKNMQCRRSDETEWVDVSRDSVYIDYLYDKPMGSFDNVNETDCKTRCEDISEKCAVIQYTTLCDWYEYSSLYSYRTSLVDSKYNGFIRICPAASNRGGSIMGYLLGKLDWDDITTIVYQPGIIASHGFPFHYSSGETWLWEVFLDNNYINLVMYNISFNRNKLFENSLESASRFTDRTDRLYIVNAAFDLNMIYSDDTLDSIGNIFATLDIRNKDKVPHFKTNLKKLILIWRTVVLEVPRDELARGFRLLAYGSDMPTCVSLDNCFWNTALITSRSISGEFFSSTDEWWHILADPNRYINLFFEHFDIECDAQTLLEISVNKETTNSYCNTNKPIEGIKSMNRELTITFKYVKELNRPTEGFAGAYEEQSRSISVESIEMEESAEYLRGNSSTLETIKVCSSNFSKCYILLDDLSPLYTVSKHTWLFIEYEICQKHNWTLVSLHSKQEQDFIASILQTKYDHTVDGFAYIGLLRQGSTKITSHWSDGSPVTFTSWGRDQPSPIPGEYCTRMSLSLSEEHVWESVTCNLPSASVAVCQYLLGNEQDTPPIEEEWTSFNPAESPSIYFVCNNEEIISFLGRCNNVVDCLDGSDEINCAKTDSCTVLQHSCGDGQCVSISVLCDHHYDCLDYSDENCYFPECKLGEFRCQNDVCIDENKHCDGKIDCDDESDEIGCVQTNCADGKSFQCSYITCIPLMYKCDGVADCVDRSDERSCQFPRILQTNCADGKSFQCSYTTCIPLVYKCDGVADCVDRSDERSCQFPRTLQTNFADGKSFQCSYITCIPLVYKCDGVADCVDRSDERSCQFPRTCQEWWYAGYQESGVYNIFGTSVLCEFPLQRNQTIITKFYNIDHGRSLIGNDIIQLTYSSYDSLLKVMKDNRCYQTIDQLCQPWVQLLYDIDTSVNKDPTSADWSPDYIHICMCLRYKTFINFGGAGNDSGIIQECNGRSLPNSIEDSFHFEVQTNVPHKYIETLQLKPGHIFDVGKMTIIVNTLVCEADFKTETHGIACGYGFTASRSTKCLYKLDQYGHIEGCRSLQHLQNCAHFVCPEDYFKCPKSFCLEKQYVCDNIPQCQNGEDELNCEKRSCTNQYRCLDSSICLPQHYHCDGIPHCPREDDERLCDFRCPNGCTCIGLAVNCTSAVASNVTLGVSISSSTRLLDVSHNPLFLQQLSLDEENVQYINHLNVSACKIRNLSILGLRSMKNLLVLDLRFNYIEILESNTFISQTRLKSLQLNNNFGMMTFEQNAFMGLISLRHLELQNIRIERLSKLTFSYLHLDMLIISNSVINQIQSSAFETLSVDELYITKSTIKSFSDDMFKGIESIDLLVMDEFKFCCIRPYFLSEESCFPQKNAFSSCSDLMRNDILRSLIWIIGVFAILGNGASLLYRFLFDRERLKLGYGLFVSNLAVSDFLMGVYLMIIAIADMHYRGDYIKNAENWRNSGFCQFAGVLASLSSEASVVFIALITLDRILVVKFPFGDFRITEIPALFMTVIAWVFSIILAIIPLLVTSYFKGQFYSKTGVCLALPLTSDKPPGWMYSVSIFIGFNFIAIVMVIFGQWLIYHEIVASKKSLGKRLTNRSKDLKVARNLLLVASTDFLCWFPVGILGMMALSGTEISGDIYAWMAVLVLPINSALNPFLYTLSAILGKKSMVPQKSEHVTTLSFPKGQVDEFFRIWQDPQYSTKPKQGYVSIKAWLDDNHLNYHHCLYIVAKTVRCLERLLNNGLVQTNLTANDILVKKTMKCVHVSLICRPELSTKEKQIKENIKCFGTIVDWLLETCERKKIRLTSKQLQMQNK